MADHFPNRDLPSRMILRGLPSANGAVFLMMISRNFLNSSAVVPCVETMKAGCLRQLDRATKIVTEVATWNCGRAMSWGSFIHVFICVGRLCMEMSIGCQAKVRSLARQAMVDLQRLCIRQCKRWVLQLRACSEFLWLRVCVRSAVGGRRRLSALSEALCVSS